MTAPYPPEAIANMFIDQATASGCTDLTSMKLLKLVYIAHGWYMGHDKPPLISDIVQAWKFGPVIPSLYHSVSHYDDQSIADKIRKVEFSNDDGQMHWSKYTIDEDDSDTPTLINNVWNAYKHLTAFDLSGLTHREGTPWSQIAEKFGAGGIMPNNVTIPEELIRGYYKQRVEELKNG